MRFPSQKRSLLTFWTKQISPADITNPKNVFVKIPQNSVSQSNEQVIGAEAEDSEPSDGYFSLPPFTGNKNYAPYFINNYLLGNY